MKPRPDADRKTEERAFHDRYFGGEPLRTSQEAFYNERVRHVLLNYAFSELAEIRGKRILYYGCGANSSILLHLAKAEAHVVAIDISKEAVKAIQEAIHTSGMNGYASVMQMDGENLAFQASSFDLIFGRAILHHLDTRRCGEELSRVLARNGRAVFIEPLGSNPVINLYRHLTPESRTSDEHPFMPEDFAELSRHFPRMKQKPFFLFALASFFFNTIIESAVLFNFFFQALSRWDAFLVRFFPSLGKYYWTTVLTLEK